MKTARPIAAAERAWLAAGGRDEGWHNLGLWQPGDAYATAAARLAQAVVHAVRAKPQARWLVVACGAGAELALALRSDAAHVLALDADPANAAAAAQMHASDARVQVQCLDVMADDVTHALPAASFDAVICIDAAYHLAPRKRWLHAMRRVLRGGGRIAFCDLVADMRPWPLPLVWHAVARGAGIDARDIVSQSAALARLGNAGFEDARAERLDDAVLGGFARFVRQQRSKQGSAGQRARATARAIGPCRAAGLGYAIFSATASAERTALSSRGTPSSA